MQTLTLLALLTSGCILKSEGDTAEVNKAGLSVDGGGEDTAAAPGGETGGEDADGDGVVDAEDCDDSDGAINPNAPETECDGVDANCDGAAEPDLLGDTSACAGESCLEILSARPDAPDGAYFVNPGSGAVEVDCQMSVDGGGWTQLRQAYLDGLAGGVEREYLYTDGAAFYISPPTELLWSWGAFQPLEGTYWYAANGEAPTDSFDCTHAEDGDFGVGCSSGPYTNYKVLPIYTIDDAAEGTCTVCQDLPDVFEVGDCADAVQIYVR